MEGHEFRAAGAFCIGVLVFVLGAALPILSVAHVAEAQSASDVVWGVKTGDVVAWTFNTRTLTPSSDDKESIVVRWEIREIHTDLSVLVKETVINPGCSPLCLGYDVTLSLGTSIRALLVGQQNHFTAGIYPLYLNGLSLFQLVAVDKALQMDWKDVGDYITGYGIEGAGGGGYTPPETYWLDLSIHKGTGIVTTGEWYYNSNEYSVTTSSTLKTSSNFDWSSRVPFVPLTTRAEADHLAGDVPLTASFSATANGGVFPYTYSWTFGDGGASTLPNPAHTFRTAGSFSVVLTVTDTSGQSAVDTLTVDVTNPSEPSTPIVPIGGLGRSSALILGFGVAVAALAGLAAFLIRRRGAMGRLPPPARKPESGPAPTMPASCRNCGSAVASQTKFCAACGARV